MFSNLEEEIEFFSPNEDLKVKVEEIYAGKKIVIIDNFYKYPDKIQELATNIPGTYNPAIIAGVPGSRVDASYYLSFLKDMFNEIINHVYFPTTKEYDCSSHLEKATFCVNIIKDTNILPRQFPHIDGAENFAASIFLNSQENCAGGTSFYTYKGEITPVNYPDKDLFSDRYSGYVQENCNDFKKIYTAEMKFNRLILYNRNLLHTAYIPHNSFNIEIPRINQMIFL